MGEGRRGEEAAEGHRRAGMAAHAAALKEKEVILARPPETKTSLLHEPGHGSGPRRSLERGGLPMPKISGSLGDNPRELRWSVNYYSASFRRDMPGKQGPARRCACRGCSDPQNGRIARASAAARPSPRLEYLESVPVGTRLPTGPTLLSCLVRLWSSGGKTHLANFLRLRRGTPCGGTEELQPPSLRGNNKSAKPVSSRWRSLASCSSHARPDFPRVRRRNLRLQLSPPGYLPDSRTTPTSLPQPP